MYMYVGHPIYTCTCTYVWWKLDGQLQFHSWITIFSMGLVYTYVCIYVYIIHVHVYDCRYWTGKLRWITRASGWMRQPGITSLNWTSTHTQTHTHTRTQTHTCAYNMCECTWVVYLPYTHLSLQTGKLHGYSQLIWAVPTWLAPVVHLCWAWEHSSTRCIIHYRVTYLHTEVLAKAA